MNLTGIANLALQVIGTRTTVTAAELAAAASNEAIQFNLAYAQVRDELLRLAPWQCAKGMIPLQYITSLPGTPENQSIPGNLVQWTPGLPLPPWTYEYAYPTDCLRALYIVPQFNPGVVGTPIYPVATSTGYQATWQGPPIKFDVGNDQFYAVTGATPATGGTGYAIGDQITLATGPVTSSPIGAPATLTVSSIGAGGTVTGVTVVPTIFGEDTPQTGAYFAQLTTPQAQGSTTGVGTGATFTLTYTPRSQQEVILTNQEFAVLSYVRRVTDPNVMDDLFVKAYYHLLGAVLNMALTGDKARSNDLIKIGNQVIQEARSTDANEALTVNDVTPDWLRARGIIYSDYWNSGFGSGWDAYGLWPVY